MVVAVSSDNSGKKPYLTAHRGWNLSKRILKTLLMFQLNRLVDCWLTTQIKIGASVLVRGLRAVSDFEFEFQMAQMNRHLDSSLETIFLMPNEKYFYTSSSLIKQVHLFGNRMTGLVPTNVALALSGLAKKNNS